ncbi:HlyD family efflux transporter periplasmic adaptor subunit [Falsiroseomonas sp. E2-1-a20]|uniref:HlyD family efflux transporter periplasmic adaptor subunit n=1 Tax=Falsiroseomonas sp. E2-1-a20 TaxID=3239300 RepID=UPI003F33F33E
MRTLIQLGAPAVREPAASVGPPAIAWSQSGRRMHPRVRLPAHLEVGQVPYPLKDWSLGGAAMEGAGPPSQIGDLHRAYLVLSHPVTPRPVEVGIRILSTEAGRATTIQFIEIQLADARWLDQTIKTWLEDSGHGTDLATSSTQQISASRTSGMSLLPVGLPGARSLVAVVALASGFMLLAIVAWLLLSQRLAVYSDFAAVSQSLRVLRAPQAGILSPLTTVQGDRLLAGRPIATLTPVMPPQIEAELAPLIQEAEARLLALRDEHDQAQAGLEGFRARMEAALRAASSNRQLISQQVSAQARVFQRLQTLSRQNIVSAHRVDQEEVVLLAQRRSLAEAQLAETEARQSLADADRGRFLSDGRPNQRSPADIEREIRSLAARRDELRATSARLTAPIVLAAPCDCLVVHATAAGGAFVAAGEILLGLAQPGSSLEVEVDALVPSNRMAFIRQGQAVRVQLAGHEDYTTGTITAMNLNPENTGRVGLPDNLRSLKPYGLVTVTLDESARGLPAGQPALLIAPVDLRLLLQQVPGLSWLVTDHPDPSLRMA